MSEGGGSLGGVPLCGGGLPRAAADVGSALGDRCRPLAAAAAAAAAAVGAAGEAAVGAAGEAAVEGTCRPRQSTAAEAAEAAVAEEAEEEGTCSGARGVCGCTPRCDPGATSSRCAPEKDCICRAGRSCGPPG